MLRSILRVSGFWLTGLLVVLLCCGWARAEITVSMNTEAARATLQALLNPALGYEQALAIAKLQGNQGAIRKLQEFKIAATSEAFATALVACAQGRKPADKVSEAFFFDMVKPKAAQLLELVKQIEGNPEAFQGAIERRIAMYTPPGTDVALQGYILAGGDGGGYAFGATDFYLNLGFNDDLILAKITTTHELYHAVQGAFAKYRNLPPEDTTHLAHGAQVCANTGQLLANLYEEGTALYVEDEPLLEGSKSESAARIRDDLSDGRKHIRGSATLLEMSVVSLGAAQAVPFDEVYGVGFFGHGVLYNIAGVMAKDIAENDGPQGLAMFLKQPAAKFVLHYTELPKYGADDAHPKLGPNTIAAAKAQLSGCR